MVIMMGWKNKSGGITIIMNMNMSVRDFLSYAMEDWYACKVYSFNENGVVLDGTIGDVLDSKFANSELNSFDIGDDGLCVNIDGF